MKFVKITEHSSVGVVGPIGTISQQHLAPSRASPVIRSEAKDVPKGTPPRTDKPQTKI
ncbi:MAG: hypothetical protein J6X14_10305 [Lachnospiraceae bacterium]|nr:hypothetical protein [Lachnospiraceae bacterium]